MAQIVKSFELKTHLPCHYDVSISYFIRGPVKFRPTYCYDVYTVEAHSPNHAKRLARREMFRHNHNAYDVMIHHVRSVD
jgi:hypothetical protein